MISGDDPVFAVIDVSTMHGLEIGPLTHPRVRKTDGTITYLDHGSTEELRRKYAPNQQLAPTINDLVEVDIVQLPGQTLAEALGAAAPFDYVIAAHVIEHIPNVIGWLREVACVLKPRGILSLVIPDKRYTFDINRTPTELSEFVDCYLRTLSNPTLRQIFDFFSRTVTIDGMVDTAALWEGTIDYDGVIRDDVPDPIVHAYRVCEEQAENSSFLDIHCHVFTPASFIAVLEGLVRLGLLDFEVAEFHPTARNTLEFHVSLRRLDGTETTAGQLASLKRFVANTRPSAEPAIPQPDLAVGGRAMMDVSHLEKVLLMGKRRLLGTLRDKRPYERLSTLISRPSGRSR